MTSQRFMPPDEFMSEIPAEGDPESDTDCNAPIDVDAAYDRVRRAALTESRVGAVGLELESHLVRLADVTLPVPWQLAEGLPSALAPVAGRSRVTLEPGSQLELSGSPEAEIGTAIAQMRRDERGVRLALAELGLGVVHAGADPVRPPRCTNPRGRYRAMEEHFAAHGRGGAGAVVMASTAAIQLNLQAGPGNSWAGRVALAHRLGPVMIAISASSPWLAGADTGWKSARQRAWFGLDPRTCGPLLGTAPLTQGPTAAWARFAMAAPVTFVTSADGSHEVAVRQTVRFSDWASGAIRLGDRLPTVADLDTHLTTLFPPVRLRGYLEIRYLDMTAPRWWPGIAAALTTLLDDPVAADLARAATEETATLWTEAARDGLGDPRLASAARACLQIAADHVPDQVAVAVGDLAELVHSGRCPGDLFGERVQQIGLVQAFSELAHV